MQMQMPSEPDPNPEGLVRSVHDQRAPLSKTFRPDRLGAIECPELDSFGQRIRPALWSADRRYGRTLLHVFATNLRVYRELEGILAMRLQSKGAPDATCCCLRRPGLAGPRYARAPAVCIRRLLLQPNGNCRVDPHITERA